MPEPRNRVVPKPKEHDHPSIHCYKKWGAEGCGREHDHTKCRDLTVTWQREARVRRRTGAEKASDTRRSGPLSEDEVTRLRRQVGLIK
jgi:hypothetical protein